jgi:ABC-2 type transport system permease protein
MSGGMPGLLRSEWIKLRSVRSHLVLLGLAIGFPTVVCVLTALLSDVEEGRGDELPGLITGTSIVSALCLGVVGVLVFAQEANFGTLRVTYAATPHRLRVVIAKALVLAATAVGLMVTVIAVNLVVAGGIVRSRDGLVDISGPPDTVPAFIGLVVLGVLLSWLGLALGMLIRNAPAAVAIIVLWPLIIENIVGGLLTLVGDDLFKFLPYTSGVTIVFVESPTEFFGRVWSGAYFGVWVLALVALGAVVNQRRDA